MNEIQGYIPSVNRKIVCNKSEEQGLALGHPLRARCYKKKEGEGGGGGI